VAAAPAAAQDVRLSGQVLLGRGADSVPVPGAWVVLHEVRMDGGGPIDSVRADRAGRFRLARARSDTAALYMVSAAYHGLTYFSTALTAAEAARDVPPLVVFDTSSTGPALLVAQRHIVVRSGETEATLTVLELVALANDGRTARVVGDPPRPTWVGQLPAGASSFSVGQGDVSSEAVTLVGDSVVVTAAVPPGTKQLVFTYEVPREKELRIPVVEPTERLLVLVDDTTATVVEGPVTRRGVETFNDTQFALFDGAAPAGGTAFVLRLGGRPLRGTVVTGIVVGLAAVLLLLAIPLLLRRRTGFAVIAPPESPDALARAIAALDLEHEAAADRSPEADAAYRERRAALKARLAEALARGSGGS
jgi:hypothetical protein